MSRINVTPPQLLPRKQLVAEYRELLRVRHAWPRRTEPQIPSSYRMGTGHITFFYDKGRWLLQRHEALRREMLKRQYKAKYTLDLSHWPDHAMGDWTPDIDAMIRNVARILNRI